MIEVKNVVKTFDGFRALDDLTMTVPHGAVYGLVGPNGAGKSTIIRHLAGIYRQDSGDVLVDGQPVYENTAVKSRMAVIGDDWYYFPQSGIREMAKFLAGIYPDFSWERYEKLERSLSDLQDNTVKLQVAYQGVTEPPLPAELNILHRSHVGRVYTYIVRGSSQEIMRRMQITEPVLLESIPLTLEEIFIYELGGVDYAAKDILL